MLDVIINDSTTLIIAVAVKIYIELSLSQNFTYIWQMYKIEQHTYKRHWVGGSNRSVFFLLARFVPTLPQDARLPTFRFTQQRTRDASSFTQHWTSTTLWFAQHRTQTTSHFKVGRSTEVIRLLLYGAAIAGLLSTRPTRTVYSVQV